jgi:DNA-binding PucR family transcriptional regulator
MSLCYPPRRITCEPEVARAIHVHPQTVRYRLNQLRDLFGDDPDTRFELMVVTRARTLRGRSWPG